MEQLLIALSLFPKASFRHWPNLAFYFFGWAVFRTTRLKLFRERMLKFKKLVAVGDVEGNCGLNFLHEILVREIYAFKDFVADESIKVIFDVGANAGFFTLWSIAHNPVAQATCFEPHPISATRLRKQIAANSADARITVVEAAAGSSSGRGTLNISPDSSMGFVSDSTHKVFENETKVEIEITTLDRFALSTGFFPDLLKIDVEGFEVEVLKGAGRCLASAKYVILEYHSEQLRTECLKLLRNAQFQVESRDSIFFAEKRAAKHPSEADHSRAAAAT